MAEGGGVEGRAAGAGGVRLGVADQGRHGADLGGEFAGGLFDVGHEVLFEKQVARRVARDHEFGVDHQFGALGDEGLVGLEDAAGVAGEVADDGVDLGQADAHGKGAQLEGKALDCNLKPCVTAAIVGACLQAIRDCAP